MKKQGKARQEKETAKNTAAGCCEGMKCECGPGMKKFIERLCCGTGKRCR